MAHADYDCCVICDTKMNYNEQAETKQSLCEDCSNVKVWNSQIQNFENKKYAKEDFIKDIETIDWIIDLINFLSRKKYRCCFYYNNDIDNMVVNKIKYLANKEQNE